MSSFDDKMIPLRIEARSPLTEIRISDARFRDVGPQAHTGLVETLLPRGVYQVSFREGKALQTKIVLLTASKAGQVIVKQPAKTTRSIVPQPHRDSRYESVAVTTAAPSAGNSVLTIRSCRALTADTDAPLSALPALTLLSADGQTTITAREADAVDPRLRQFEVRPGNWCVRFDETAVSDPIEAPLTVCPNWHTVVDVQLEAIGPNCKIRWRSADSEVRLCKGTTLDDDPAFTAYGRMALSSLATRRSMQGPAFESLLCGIVHEKVGNPMLGIYAAHMLPLNTETERALAGDIVENLAKLVCGPEGTNRPADFVHPDVQALRLRLLLARGEPLDSVAPFHFPPMLAASWRVLIDAATRAPGLIPKGSFTSAISARVFATDPWLVWTRSRRKQADVKVEFEDFGTNARIIRAALGHSSLRNWYRAGVVGAEEANYPVIGARERVLGGHLRSIAEDEGHQPIFDAAFIREARAETEPLSADVVGKYTRLPPAAVLEAAEMLAAKFLERARAENIDLIARSTMAVPELIIPYNPAFLGDGFAVPLPMLSPALRAQAYADAAIVDYTHYSLVMHSRRKVAIFAASNIDAARKVRVPGGLSWRMDERVGDYQLGPELYANSSPDRGHLVRRDGVLWGTVPEARHANKSAFFYSNAAPQHQSFDHDEWAALEDWVLDRATDFSYRLCVFTGPVLRDNDPTLEDLPPPLRLTFSSQGPVQIPAAFWKVIVLRDASAAGEDLSVVAFAMRQSEMWNDKEGGQLQSLKVHQVTLRAIEDWTGLNFGDLKRSDELEWSDDRSRVWEAGVAPEWPQIRSGADIVYSGPARRRRGFRAVRAIDARSTAPSVRVAQSVSADCECNSASEGFDARAAIVALNKDVIRLTELLAAPSKPEGVANAAAAGKARSAAPSDAPSADIVPTNDERVESIVAESPAAIHTEMRAFMREITEQGDINRGTRRVSTPRQLERIIGGEDVPPGGFLSCVCIGNATDWFCSGALIAPRVVLTAAHCGDKITRVMVGGNSVKFGLDTSARVIPVQHVHTHSGYKPYPLSENDITLLVLAQPAGVPPVNIADLAQLRDSTDVQLVGFGYNDAARPLGFGTKRQVRVPMAPTIRLDESTDVSALEAMFGFHSQYEFVAGRKGLGRDSCNGDSGGPAYLPVGRDFVLGGLTSRATQDSVQSCGDGGIYVRPDRFLDWIRATMSASGLPSLLS